MSQAAGSPALAVRVEGSSTVHPISRTVAERYGQVSRNPIDVKSSSTGAGFQLFCHGKVDIAGASRPINGAELKGCADSGVEFVELPIGLDGIAVVVHPDNDWARDTTVSELKRLWEPAAQGKILRWQDLRPEWPPVRIHLVGPDPMSGTFDYFTKAIVGEQGESRRDYFASDDDQRLVEAVAHDGLALGYFGLAYLLHHQQQLRPLAIDDGVTDNGPGAIGPTLAAVRDARYQPLSRPLFLYVSVASLKRAEVDDFVRFYLDATVTAVADAGYVVLPRRVGERVAARLRDRQAGSTFEASGALVGVSIATLMDTFHMEVSTHK